MKFCTIAAIALAFVAVSSHAQTPSAPNEGSGLNRSAAGVDTFSWWSRAGRTYFIQQSNDLVNWVYMPVIELGADQPISWSFATNSDKLFLRLKSSDIPTNDPFAADSDDDGVGNWDELMQGADPLAAADTDHNGLADDWEIHYFGQIGVNPDALAERGDGFTNLQAFQQRLSPHDVLEGLTPTLTIVSNDPQTAPPARFLPAALVVSVADANGLPLANAPVTFTVVAGGGQLQASSSASLVNVLGRRTNESGEAGVYFKLPAAPNQTCQIVAVAGKPGRQAQVTLTAVSGDTSAPATVSPFAPTDFIAQGRPDMSVDMTWTNHTDDQTPVEIEIQRADGSWRLVATLPPGTTSYHMPARP